jgi:hypothetical protein
MIAVATSSDERQFRMFRFLDEIAKGSRQLRWLSAAPL